MFFEFEGRMSEVGRKLSCTLQWFSEGRNCRVLFRLYTRSVCCSLSFACRHQGPSLQHRTHKRQQHRKLNQRFLSHTLVGIFRSFVAHRRKWVGNVAALESIFRMKRGWGVRREFGKGKRRNRVWVSTRSGVELPAIEFSCWGRPRWVYNMVMKIFQLSAPFNAALQSNQRDFYVKRTIPWQWLGGRRKLVSELAFFSCLRCHGSQDSQEVVFIANYDERAFVRLWRRNANNFRSAALQMSRRQDGIPRAR